MTRSPELGAEILTSCLLERDDWDDVRIPLRREPKSLPRKPVAGRNGLSIRRISSLTLGTQDTNVARAQGCTDLLHNESEQWSRSQYRQLWRTALLEEDIQNERKRPSLVRHHRLDEEVVVRTGNRHAGRNLLVNGPAVMQTASDLSQHLPQSRSSSTRYRLPSTAGSTTPEQGAFPLPPVRALHQGSH